jgi:hypothetical protein
MIVNFLIPIDSELIKKIMYACLFIRNVQEKLHFYEFYFI